MGDWTVAIGIVVVAVLWVQIFLDYRRKLVRLMPTVSQATSRKADMSTQITAAESEVETIRLSIGEMQKEIRQLEDRRVDLQDKLNPLEMVRVPAGKLRMGSNSPGRDDENPEHIVHVSEFLIDKYEVTNLQYKEFIEATGHRAPSHWRNRTFPDARRATHPVVNVSWEDAREYCAWVGKRLPTEAEWERAALGDGRNDYPWGRSCSPEAANYENPDGKTTPVDKYDAKGKSEFGVCDLCGNVGEWVNDWFDKMYYANSPEIDPKGPETGYQRVFRGGAFQENRIGIRGKTRNFAMPQASNDYVGFRCAMDANPK
ncbi:MAG: SUMF1/EgtB/PvdO family nonheme iron enzyme [Gemmatimonadota bacterium]